MYPGAPGVTNSVDVNPRGDASKGTRRVGDRSARDPSNLGVMMNDGQYVRRGLGAAALVAGTGAVAGAVVLARRRRGAEPDRWHGVTINCSPDRLDPLPPPLDELGFPVEIRIRPAAGDRGTELAARSAGDAAGPGAVERRRHLRRALREARSLAEVGEVLLPDAPPTTRPTLTGAPLAYATRHGREEGRL
jgi:hypothetical protein